MDTRVYEVQIWLGQTFPAYFYYDEEGNNSGSYPIIPDGITGATTVKALIMALQIHLGLTPVDGIWGNGTSSKCPTVSSVSNSTLIKIAQGGFICKGYNPGALDGIFGASTQKAIRAFKKDLGFTSFSDVLEVSYFKSLLTTDPTIETNTTNGMIRLVQQYLNAKYSNLFVSKLGYIPTSGHLERKTSTALIYAFQSAIGTTADGILGQNSFSKMPNLTFGSNATEQIAILKCALNCNGLYTDNLDGIYNEQVVNLVTQFQYLMCLNLDSFVVLGAVNRRTWGALLWSKGDTERQPNACDCRTKILDTNLALSLFNLGFMYIGRYLTNVEPNGYDKMMTREEVKTLVNSGLKIFPIFQESKHNPVMPTDFSEERGKVDAERAIQAALNLGFKENTIIYFALDCDLMDVEIKNHAIPYFKGIKDVFNEYVNYYQIGVYGSRHSCVTICNGKYAISSFVADMSTAYSGNLGFSIPENWAFEQYIEKKNYSLGGYTFDLDYDMASGRDSGVSEIELAFDKNQYTPPYIPKKEEVSGMKSILELIPIVRWLEDIYYSSKGIITPDVAQARSCYLAVLDYLYQYQYKDYKWEFISPVDFSFINFINTNYSEHENIKMLYPYIFAKEEGEENDKIVTRAKVITDGGFGILELPHLAVVIKCYIEAMTPGSWSAWAGDFATAVKEVYVNCQQNSEEYISFESERLGAMEADVVSVVEARMFNYCDLIADLDGYAIEKLMDKSLSRYSLSDCMSEYYSDIDKYAKRYQYFKQIIGFDHWSVIDIKKSILKHFNPILKKFFAENADDYPLSDDAAAIVLALNILFWAKYTFVI